MKLPKIIDLELSGKRVLLRVNYDVPLEKGANGQIADTSRIDESLQTIEYLLEKKAKVILLSHLGRPGGKVDPDLSLKPIADYLASKLGKQIPLIKEINELDNDSDLLMLENLRFWPQEENNDKIFAKTLAGFADFFINDAFANSHRSHTSMVGLPCFLPSAFGFACQKEIETLIKIKDQPQRPLVLILGGAKEEKLTVLSALSQWADYVLIGGKLPEFLYQSVDAEKVKIAKLDNERQDITPDSLTQFEEFVKTAKTIIWAGPMGSCQSEDSSQATRKLGQVVVESQAFTIIGGGNTKDFLTKFNLVDKINYVSSGGTAMLEFLAKGTLPGIEAILKGVNNG